MEFPLKLLELRQTLKLTQEEMAQRMGISSNYVSLLEKGKKEPSPAIRRHLELIERLAQAGMASPAEGYTLRNEPRISYGVHKVACVPRMIPIIGWAHAGVACNYEEIPADWQDQIPCTIRDPKAFAVRLEGDSMEPKFSPGDLLILQPSGEFAGGGLAVIKMKTNDFIFRRVERRADFLRLIPLNPQWPAEDLPHSEVEWVYPVWGMWRQISKSD